MKSKTLFVGLAAAALAIFTGCNGKNTPGGPGASHRSSDRRGPQIGQAENSFTLSPPMTSTTLKQGEIQTVTIKIKRGKNFDQDVALKLDDLPKGVSIDPASPVLKKGEEETGLKVKAADDAAVGDFTVKVTGHPSQGADAHSEVKLKIEKKK